MGNEVQASGNILGKWVPARYILAVLGSCGMAIVYGLKVNLSVAMVAMLNHTAIAALHNNSMTSSNNNNNNSNNSSNVYESREEVCTTSVGGFNETIVEDGPFVWDEDIKGTLLSCYFWGYLISQIPSGQVAEKFSAKWVMLFSVGINVIATLLTPILTVQHYVGLIVMRVLEGIGGGATFPAMHCLIAAWSPPSERSVMSTIIYVGTSAGTAISILLAGVLSEHWGWESIFYWMGGLSTIWMVLWLFLIQDTPNKQRLISAEERQMIIKSLGGPKRAAACEPEQHPPVPWRAVLTSVPFWAILIAHCCSNWGWYMFLIEIPFYMKDVFKFNMASNALFTAVPYFIMLIMSILIGKVFDSLRSKTILTTTHVRKIATGVCTILPAISLLGLCYVGCRRITAVLLMTNGVVCMGAMFSGFLSNHIDIAPNYAGTLVSITNTAATIPGIIVPKFVGYITRDDKSIASWRIIFFVTIVLFIIEFVVFTTFGSGEEQSWNKIKKKKESKKEVAPLNPQPSKEAV